MSVTRFVLVATLVFGVAGCITTRAPVVNENLHLPAPFRALNSSSVPTRVGVIYVLRLNSTTEVMDVLGERAIGDSGGWTTQFTNNIVQEIALGRLNVFKGSGICRSSEQIAIGLRTAFCPRVIPVDVTFEMRGFRIDRLTEPFGILEILNRPGSGLIYNREADARVMQRRTSLAEAIAQHTALAGEQVAVCTEVQTVLYSQILIRGRISAERALETARRIASRNALEIDEVAISSTIANGEPLVSFPIKGLFTVSAEFRNIGLVDVSTSPRIDYRLGGVKSIDMRAP